MRERSGSVLREPMSWRVAPSRASGRVAVVLMVLAGLSWSCTERSEPVDPVASESHRAWQQERIAELRAEDGWLAVVGLAWLDEGEQTIGWGVGDGQMPDIVLPEAPQAAPAVLARIRVEVVESELRAWIATNDCADCRLENGSSAAFLADDGTWTAFYLPSLEETVVLHAYGFEIFTIERGGRLALRVRNRNSPRREVLVSIPTHDYDPAWTVEGRFDPAQGVRELAIDNSTDRDYPQRSVGRFVFERDGEEFAMELVGADPEVPQLLMVGDPSNGSTTYGGGRYVYVEVEEGGLIRADFNRLYNPPCVFTPWATCPLPPASNRLPFEVPVGEMNPIFEGGAK